VKPVLQALLLADNVYEDKRTGKKVIAGTFDTYMVAKDTKAEDKEPEGDEAGKAPEQPAVLPFERAGTPYAYISLTDLHGPTDLQLRFVSLDSHEALMSTVDFKVTTNSPLDTAEIVVPVPPLPREPGVYALELVHDDEPLGAHRIRVQEIQR